MYKYLKTRREKHTLWVEIHNPPVNFMLTQWMEELFEIVKKVRDDDSVRVLVLTGGVPDQYIMHFSIDELSRIIPDNKKIGLDRIAKSKPLSGMVRRLNTFNNLLMDLSPKYEKRCLAGAKSFSGKVSSLFLQLQIHRLGLAIERLNKITIAAINGPCNGGGMELSACFDFRFMVGDQGFTLGQPEVLIGIIPGGGGSQRIPRILGRAKALEWMLTGSQMSPEEAKRLGLITDFFPKRNFFSAIQAFSDKMALRPPVAVNAIKKAVHQGMETTLRDGLSLEMAGSLECFASQDAEMAMERYIDFINKNINVPEDERLRPEDVIHIMENASIFEKFKGK